MIQCCLVGGFIAIYRKRSGPSERDVFADGEGQRLVFDDQHENGFANSGDPSANNENPDICVGKRLGPTRAIN